MTPGRSPEEGLLGLLGFAARARALVFGTDGVRRGIREGGVGFVLLAEDGSPTQRRKLVPLLEARNVPYRVLFGQERLGAAMGRAPVSAVGLTDRNFVRRAAELADALSSPQD